MLMIICVPHGLHVTFIITTTHNKSPHLAFSVKLAEEEDITGRGIEPNSGDVTVTKLLSMQSEHNHKREARMRKSCRHVSLSIIT